MFGIYYLSCIQMPQMQISFQKFFFTLASVLGLFTVLFFAKTILIPLCVALLLSFILLPVAKRLERWGTNKLLAAFLSILLLIYYHWRAYLLFFSTDTANIR